MADPTTTTAAGVTAIGIFLLGPKLGPVLAPLISDYTAILAGALIGIMHAAGKVHTATMAASVIYVIKWVGTAVLLTGALSVLVEQKLAVPATQWPGVVAFCITFLADRWPDWLRMLVPRWLGLGTVAGSTPKTPGDGGAQP